MASSFDFEHLSALSGLPRSFDFERSGLSTKVAIIGPESTGKTTLARYLAKRYHGIFVPEYARSFVEQLMAERQTDDWTKVLTYDDLCTLAQHQIETLTSPPFMGESEGGLYFFDTDLLVTKVWFNYAFGRIPEWLNEAILRYPMDVYLLTYPDLPWVPDPTRSNGSDAIRLELFRRYESEIQSLDIPYYIIRHT